MKKRKTLSLPTQVTSLSLHPSLVPAMLIIIQTTNSTEVTGYQFRTKLGRVLIDIAPDTDLVLSYDRTRAELKAQRIANQTQKQTTITTYKSISQKVKLERLRVYKHAVREVNNFSASTTTYLASFPGCFGNEATTYPEQI